MLGRLRMSIKDCIDTYCNLGREIFEKRQPFHFLGQDKYDCAKLERIIKNVVQRHGGSPDALIADSSVLNKSHPNKQERAQNRCITCRVYVSIYKVLKKAMTDVCTGAFLLYKVTRIVASMKNYICSALISTTRHQMPKSGMTPLLASTIRISRLQYGR